MIHDPLQLSAVFLGIVTIAVWLDASFSWARKISPVLMILFLAGVLSNTGVIADSSPFYGAVSGFAVPFAVCLILVTVRLKDLKSVGRPLIVAFALSCVGTMLAALAAGLMLQAPLAKILGDDAWKLAGPFTGTYTGGSLNFFALWDGLEIGDPDLFAAANAVDNLTFFPLFTLWILIPTWLGKRYPISRRWGEIDMEPIAEHEDEGAIELRIPDLATLAFLAVAVMVVSNLIKSWWIAPIMPSLPTILIVTTLALILGQFRFVGRLQGGMEIGTFAFYLFFCAVGAMINVKKAILLSPVLFVYVVVMILIHIVAVYGIGRLLHLDIRILTIASVAAKTGPSSVVAVANAHGWKHLVLPGVAMGLLGYAVGNYLGFAAAYAMKALLGQ
jgi:uncharacterized membrane protein